MQRTRIAALSCILAAIAQPGLAAEPQASRLPVIDMHLHASELWAAPGEDADATFGVVFDRRELGLRAAASTADLKSQTLEALRRLNVVKAVVSGEHAEDYRREMPDRLLASPVLPDAEFPIDELRAAFQSGRFQALAEFSPQYDGLAPNDPALEPHFALAEELDVPVGMHVGLGPPGAAYGFAPRYRMAHSSALLLEDVLIRHPKLRLYVMHAGWPLLDDMVALMYAHPQVHVDLGVIDWYVPQPEFYAYLQRLIDAGFGKRIMFGSDQMVWPGAIERAIEAIETAPFLTEEQRRDILCRNAARFLRLPEDTCTAT